MEVIKTILDGEQPYELCKDEKGRLFTRNIREEATKEKAKVEVAKKEEPKTKGKKFSLTGK